MSDPRKWGWPGLRSQKHLSRNRKGNPTIPIREGPYPCGENLTIIALNLFSFPPSNAFLGGGKQLILVIIPVIISYPKEGYPLEEGIALGNI